MAEIHLRDGKDGEQHQTTTKISLSIIFTKTGFY